MLLSTDCVCSFQLIGSVLIYPQWFLALSLSPFQVKFGLELEFYLCLWWCRQVGPIARLSTKDVSWFRQSWISSLDQLKEFFSSCLLQAWSHTLGRGNRRTKFFCKACSCQDPQKVSNRLSLRIRWRQVTKYQCQVLNSVFQQSFPEKHSKENHKPSSKYH